MCSLARPQSPMCHTSRPVRGLVRVSLGGGPYRPRRRCREPVRAGWSVINAVLTKKYNVRVLNYLDWELSPEQDMVQNVVREFVEREALPLIPDCFEQGEF